MRRNSRPSVSLLAASLTLGILCDAPRAQAQVAPAQVTTAQPRPDVAATAGNVADNALAARLDAFMSQYYGEGLFNGVVLAADHGQIVFAKGYGYANLEWQVPNAADTRFPIASLTKQFTSMLVLQQVAEGKLRLDGTITDYLPDYPPEQGRRITIRQLLNHTSGLPEYTWTADLIDAQVPVRPEEFLKRFSHDPLLFTPGSTYSYSNSGYYVLGVILEKVTGKPYEQLLHERLLDPLGMSDSGYVHVEDVIPHSATGYLRVLTGRENPRYRYVDPARPVYYRSVTGYEKPIYRDMVTLYAAGAMYSTVLDLFKWDRALAAGKLLPPALAAAYFEPGKGNYASGWFGARLPLAQVRDFFDDFEGWRPRGRSQNDELVNWHTGSVNGFITSIARIPSRDQVIVVLNNTGMTRLADINAGIVGVLDGTPIPPLRHSVAERVAHTLLDQGATTATQQFRELRDRKDGDYYVSANEINTLSQSMVRMNHAKEAAMLLALGVETFPTSAKTLDALAQAYVASGDTAAAREATRKLMALVQDNRLSQHDRDEYRRSASDRMARLGDEDSPDRSTAGDSRRVGSPNG